MHANNHAASRSSPRAQTPSESNVPIMPRSANPVPPARNVPLSQRGPTLAGRGVPFAPPVRSPRGYSPRPRCSTRAPLSAVAKLASRSGATKAGPRFGARHPFFAARNAVLHLFEDDDEAAALPPTFSGRFQRRASAAGPPPPLHASPPHVVVAFAALAWRKQRRSRNSSPLHCCSTCTVPPPNPCRQRFPSHSRRRLHSGGSGGGGAELGHGGGGDWSSHHHWRPDGWTIPGRAELWCRHEQ